MNTICDDWVEHSTGVIPNSWFATWVGGCSGFGDTYDTTVGGFEQQIYVHDVCGTGKERTKSEPDVIPLWMGRVGSRAAGVNRGRDLRMHSLARSINRHS